jgi:hypothetical protein
MQKIYKVKLKESFTNEGVFYESSRLHLFSDRVFTKIPDFIIESFSELKLPFSRIEQLGFSVSSAVGKNIDRSLSDIDKIYPSSSKNISKKYIK